jgi:hydrogenase maturation protein HypF
LGVAWDGAGLGRDGTVWGGEFLRVDAESFERVACFRPFLLPGNEWAIREPRRSALGALFEIFGEQVWEIMPDDLLAAFATTEKHVLVQMLMKRTNCPQTTSVGRLFDATASILGLCHRNNYEGQAAMMLGFSAERVLTEGTYDFSVAAGKVALEVDWAPMMREILQNIEGHVSPNEIAAKFHNTLAGIIVAVARKIGEKKVVLTGGCFQNRYLTERAIAGLQNAGYIPYWHHRIPPNDGGIALGQIMAAARHFKQES